MTSTCVFVLLKAGVMRNSLLNPYKSKQTLERLKFETLFGINPLPNYQ